MSKFGIKEPCQVLNGCLYASSPVHMPSPTANIPSRYDGTRIVDNVLTRCCHGGKADYALKWPCAPARCPKGCPSAKTLCMAQDRHKTWHCSAM
eukprot:5272504-Amphidinium_carterae.1